jgi:thiol:disulfide interchange protein DsbA
MDKIHKNLFEAVQSQRVTNLSEDGMRQFFVSAGIPEQEFTQTYDSFDVTRKQKWANAISRAYRITAIPIIVVQGPRGVFVTAVKMAGSEDEVLKVANYLINMQTTPLMIPPKTTLQQNQPQPH